MNDDDDDDDDDDEDEEAVDFWVSQKKQLGPPGWSDTSSKQAPEPCQVASQTLLRFLLAEGSSIMDILIGDGGSYQHYDYEFHYYELIELMEFFRMCIASIPSPQKNPV